MEMIERADADNDGEVTAEDFFNVRATRPVAAWAATCT